MTIVESLLLEYKEIFIALITSTLLAIGYLYRTKVETKKNKKLALYQLLEIWFQLSVFYKQDFTKLFDAFIKEATITYNFPPLNDEEKKIVMEQYIPIIKNSLYLSSLKNIEEYKIKYQNAINLIAEVSPLFAYKINTINSIEQIIDYIDNYKGQISTRNTMDNNMEEVLEMSQDFVLNKEKLNSLYELENNIRILALKIGIITYFNCKKLIQKRKQYLSEIEEEEEFKENITEVLNLLVSHLSKKEI